ncbi:Circadian clock protein kaiB [Bradyrhizobium sp. ORS 278]|uniref:circadian clock KaiB family protein n=1 Tax=Bradyrhizobium sp. (strain ORS 278) TaxID=114615 RepID=UPI000150802C|nr:circadian clock KaiB family protein [Bradyrhizobium sp. ORS 278]CAL77737.1 Circadian clock protein kaiB [Bradyrhizobium sp. ORS 278]
MTYHLGLFVTGQTLHSLRAIENLRRICEQEFAGLCVVEIIDVTERPDVAERERIVATPTLVRRDPPPVRKIIGDLSDTRRVLLALGIAHDRSHASETQDGETGNGSDWSA